MSRLNQKINRHDVPVFRLFYLVLFFLPVISVVKIGSSQFSLSLADLFLPFLLIAAIYYKFYTDKGRMVKYPKYNYLFIMFFVIIIAFIVLSMSNVFRYASMSNAALVSMFTATFKILICFLYAYCFLFFFQIANEDDMKGFIKVNAFTGFFFACTCILGVALYYMGINTDLVKFGFRASGTMDDPNLAATFLLMQLGYVLLYYRMSEKKKFPNICIATMMVGVLMTSSKASVLILLLAGAATLFFAMTSEMTRAANKMIKIAFLFLVALLILMLFTDLLDGFFERMSQLTADDTADATTGRSELWYNAIVIALSGTNIIHGVGIGLYPKYLLDFFPEGTLVTLAHNTFLSFFSETGIVIPIILFCVFGYLFIRLLRLIYREKDGGALAVMFGLMSVFIMMFAVNLQNNRMIYIYLVFSFFYVWYKSSHDKKVGAFIGG